jgi:hypothetical protein
MPFLAFEKRVVTDVTCAYTSAEHIFLQKKNKKYSLRFNQ